MQYYALAAAAILSAGCLLVLQIIGGLEYTEGQSTYVRMSMIAAMVTVALLPFFIHSAMRLSRLLAFCLIVGFLAFLAYSLPASIGRIGEMKEGKVLAATDAAKFGTQLEDVQKTLRLAEPDMMRECAGAPEAPKRPEAWAEWTPPKRGWPECRRKWASVQSHRARVSELEGKLSDLGTAGRLGDTSSQLLAWAIGPTRVSEETIRRASGMALPVGLEMVIFSLFGLASAAIGAGLRSRSAITAPAPSRQPTPEIEIANDTVPLSIGGTSREEALADLAALVKAGHHPESQDWLAARWGISKGEVSKRLRHWEATGQLPGNRLTDGRRKMVVSA